MERLAGHLTCLSLVNRRTLSCFHTCYRYIRKHGDQVGRLWQSCREELLAFYGLTPLLCSRWSRGWSCQVSASDSSESGFGVCASLWKKDDVAACGRLLERTRFRGGLKMRPREAALGAIEEADNDLNCWKYWRSVARRRRATLGSFARSSRAW